MAQDTKLFLPKDVWTLLTNVNVAAARVQNRCMTSIELQATNGTTPPTGTNATLTLLAGEILAADMTLAQLWPGVTGANRLWALSWTDTSVSVSHADA